MDQSINLRQCLGKFTTGVTVVTCLDTDGVPCGITANSFSSVSLDPPLVLWNIAKVSRSLRAFLDAEFFAINMLSRNQQSLAEHFAQSEDDLFDDIEFDSSPRNVPLLVDTVASFECRTHAIHDCGDHHIIIGEAIDYRATDLEPLIYFSGRYASLAE